MAVKLVKIILKVLKYTLNIVTFSMQFYRHPRWYTCRNVVCFALLNYDYIEGESPVLSLAASSSYGQCRGLLLVTNYTGPSACVQCKPISTIIHIRTDMCL